MNVIDITKTSNGGIIVTYNGVPRTLSMSQSIEGKILYNYIGAEGILLWSEYENFRVRVFGTDTFTINGITAPKPYGDQLLLLNNAIFSGISTNAPTFPAFSGLVTDFDFSDPATITQVSGKVSQIVDKIGSVVSSQASAGIRPLYTLTGGANNLPYATFSTPSTAYYLSGGVLPATGDFTLFVIKRLANTGAPGDKGVSFHHGSNNGYAWADYGSTVAGPNSGGVYPNISSEEAPHNYTSNGRWECGVLSHSAGSTKTYNVLAAQFVAAAPASNPQTPTTSHRIGYNTGIGGYSWFVGDMERILLYNRQLSDAEVQQMGTYLAYAYALPLPSFYSSGGDSITATASAGDVTKCYPLFTATQLLPTKFLYWEQTAVSGRQSQDVLDNIQTEVVVKYQSRVKNVYSLQIGHNDLNRGVTVAQLFANVQAISNAVRAAGYKFVLLNCLNTTIYSNTITAQINALYLAAGSGLWDGYVDICNNANLIDPTNLTYYANDGTHPNAAGEQVISTLSQTIINGLL